ncbi:hypothetical protein DVH24_024228 [Malus domestica]|uniref:Uncharacterized protein n=1 Tax=Malus domestica TaxID=3750 RepID=A0A498JKT2_MALDO|nr:hypothetical protein DVH24_024228 [Malus domestica]
MYCTIKAATAAVDRPDMEPPFITRSRSPQSIQKGKLDDFLKLIFFFMGFKFIVVNFGFCGVGKSKTKKQRRRSVKKKGKKVKGKNFAYLPKLLTCFGSDTHGEYQWLHIPGLSIRLLSICHT